MRPLERRGVWIFLQLTINILINLKKKLFPYAQGANEIKTHKKEERNSICPSCLSAKEPSIQATRAQIW